MEVIEKVFEHKRPDVFHIYPLGDLHGGSNTCSEHEIRNQVQEIKERKNAYWIGMGDYADCITKNDPRFEICGLADWVEQDNIVESQRKWLVSLFKPIAHKGICLLTGNHEETIHQYHSNDLVRNLCDDLSIPYGGYQAFILLTFKRKGMEGSRQFTVHAWHGAGSAQTEGARVMRLMRLVNEIQAHIYLMGHLHAMAQYTPDRLTCVRGRIKSVKLAATMTGSWLKAYMQPANGQHLNPTYVERQGYKPTRMGCPVIHIRPDKDEFTIES